MDNIGCVKRKIEKIVEKSPVPEDPIHSKNTLAWLLKLMPDADEAFKIAALGHDMERAIEGRKVRRKDYRSHEEFKQAHALNSARILAEIMKECDVTQELIDDVFFLVLHHETGGNGRVDLLRNADSISFFHVNLPHYFTRNTVEETKMRFLWGYKKLPEDLKGVVAEFKYQVKDLQPLIRDWIAST